MKRSLLFLFVAPAILIAGLAQRGGPPRRIENPETIQLPGGSRIEFHTFEAPSLGGESNYSILLPPSYDKNPRRRYPVVYFLHGLFNDHTSWAVDRYGHLPGKIEELITQGEVPEFVMVHPNGADGFYSDYVDGSLQFEKLIWQDMRQEVESRFRIHPNRRNRSIGGVSMGGYGALKIAMKNPELYASTVAFSPIVLLGDNPMNDVEIRDPRMAKFLGALFQRVYGQPFNQRHWKQNSLQFLGRESRLDGLHIYFAYGTADRYNQVFPMEQGVRTLHQIFEERQIDHTFRIYENEPHGWELVNSHLKEAVQFLTGTFDRNSLTH